MFEPLKNKINCYVGPFTFHHNNKPCSFNPDFDPRAYDWATMATHDTIVANKYSDGSTREEIAAYRLTAYHKRKAQGDVNPLELETAKHLIYELG